MALASEALHDYVRVQRNDITVPETKGVYRVLSADAPLQHGLNPSAAIVDEYHAHKPPDLLTALTTAGGARENPLTLMLTTAGYDPESPLGELHAQALELDRIERPNPYLTIARDPASGFLFHWYGAPTTPTPTTRRCGEGRTPQAGSRRTSCASSDDPHGLGSRRDTRRRACQRLPEVCQMAGTGEQGLRERREAIVLEHLGAENRHDIEATIATFHHVRYEVNGEPSDGEAAVRELLQGLMAGFPDAHREVQKIHHADDAVIGQARMTGTHDGPFSGLPATGRRIDVAMATIFEFEEDRLMCEYVYFDIATILGQVGALSQSTGA